MRLVGFASPVWLLGLLPWAAAAAYTLRSAAAVRAVPFVALWERGGGGPRAAAAVRWRATAGPVWVLVAALAGLIAAAGPGWGRGPGVTVVFDRGVRRAWPGGDPRVAELVERARAVVGGRPVTLVCVPPWRAGGDWDRQVADAPPAVVDTAAAVQSAVADAVRRTAGGPVVVLSDQRVGGSVVQLAPAGDGGGVGLVAAAVRDRPVPQLMLRLANRSSGRAGRVRVVSGQVDFERPVSLPATGSTGDVFVDLPGGLAGTVLVEVDPSRIDGRAWLASGGPGGRVAVDAGLPEPVRRIVRVFNAAGGDGPEGSLVTAGVLAAGQAGVQVVDSGSGGGAATVSTHPVTAGVRAWAGGGAAVPDGMAVVVRVDGRPVVAVRDGPARQVWANVNVDGWSRTADFVVFMAEALRWAGGGRADYRATGPRSLGDGWALADGGPVPAGVAAGWWPGVYRADGRPPVAVNGGPADGPVPPAVVPSADGRRTTLAGIGCAAAVACLLGGAAAWPRGG